ncbi:hypothetical protein MXB_5077, partial [Myxobolus squamalis]
MTVSMPKVEEIEIDMEKITPGVATLMKEIEGRRNLSEESDENSRNNRIHSRFLTIPASHLEAVDIIVVKDFDPDGPYTPWIRKLHASLK